MNDWQERLMAQLDRDKPSWYWDWAEKHDLSDVMSLGIAEQRAKLRQRIADRMFHTILHAALGAGIVTEVK